MQHFHKIQNSLLVGKSCRILSSKILLGISSGERKGTTQATTNSRNTNAKYDNEIALVFKYSKNLVFLKANKIIS